MKFLEAMETILMSPLLNPREKHVKFIGIRHTKPKKFSESVLFILWRYEWAMKKLSKKREVKKGD